MQTLDDWIYSDSLQVLDEFVVVQCKYRMTMDYNKFLNAGIRCVCLLVR